MFSIPFAFSGVLMALFFTGTNLNVMSLLGGIMLIGIVVKNGIVPVSYTHLREKLALHGLNLSTAGNYLRNRVNGAVASKYREDGDEYDIKVRYACLLYTSLYDSAICRRFDGQPE